MNKILVVDDESIVAMGLEERLTAMGYEVAGTASSGMMTISPFLLMEKEGKRRNE